MSPNIYAGQWTGYEWTDLQSKLMLEHSNDAKAYPRQLVVRHGDVGAQCGHHVLDSVLEVLVRILGQHACLPVIFRTKDRHPLPVRRIPRRTQGAAEQPTHEWKRVKSGGTSATFEYLLPRRCSSCCSVWKTISRRRSSEISAVLEPSEKSSGMLMRGHGALVGEAGGGGGDAFGAGVRVRGASKAAAASDASGDLSLSVGVCGLVIGYVEQVDEVFS
jgi:hypothetical protein